MSNGHMHVRVYTTMRDDRICTWKYIHTCTQRNDAVSAYMHTVNTCTYSNDAMNKYMHSVHTCR